MFFHCLSLSLSRLLLAAANHIICICRTWYCSRLTRCCVLPLLCAVYSVVLHPSHNNWQGVAVGGFPKLALCSRTCTCTCALGEGTTLMAFFVLLCQCQNVCNECKNFFFFFYSANAGLCCAVTVWMPCFDAGMRWHCVGYDWHSLCDPTKRPELGAQVLSPPSRAFAKCLCFWLVELRIFTDLNNAASGRASHCALRLLSVDQNPVGTPRRRNV